MMELAPHSVMHTMQLARLHRSFRTLGLRHIFVTDTRNECMGVITRKDLLPEVLEANLHQTTANREAAKGSGARDSKQPKRRKQSCGAVLGHPGSSLFVRSESLV